MLDFLSKAVYDFIIYAIYPLGVIVVAPFIILWIRKRLQKKILVDNNIKLSINWNCFGSSFFMSKK